MKVYRVFMKPSDSNDPESGVIATVIAESPVQARNLVNNELAGIYGTNVSRVYRYPENQLEFIDPEAYTDFLTKKDSGLPSILGVSTRMET